MNKDKELLQEKRLVEQVAGGDSAAFRQLYDLSYGKVSRYVQKMVRDASLVDDILVQTYTVAWQRSVRPRATGITCFMGVSPGQTTGANSQLTYSAS